MSTPNRSKRKQTHWIYFPILAMVLLVVVFTSLFLKMDNSPLAIRWQQQPPPKDLSTLYDSYTMDDDNDDELYDRHNDFHYSEGDDDMVNSNGPFFEQYCQMEHPEEWMNPSDDWKSRTPYFLLIGAKKAGTTTLYTWLRHHPQIVGGIKKELLYFLPSQFHRYSEDGGKVQISKVRQDLYRNNFPANTTPTRHNLHTIALEATPGYALFSTLSRIPIFCSLPWVKLLMTVRDPIDRCYSNYNFYVDFQAKNRNKKKNQGLKSSQPMDRNGTSSLFWRGQYLSFEDVVQLDMADLEKAGVIQNDIPFEQFAGSPEEQEAWTKYQEMETAIDIRCMGRSLYVLQILEWQRGLRELGRDPHSEMLVVRNEDMKYDAQMVYDEILWWLELPPEELEVVPDKMVTTYRSPPMRPETRQQLEEFVEPYNRRLYRLLGWDQTKQWNSKIVN